MEKFGIDNLKVLIMFPVELGCIAGDILQDSDKSWKRWLKFIAAVPEAIELLKIDWSKVKEEYLDLSDAEREVLKELMKDKFKIHNDKIEAVVDDSFAILLNIESSIREAIKLFESLKN